MCDRQLRGGRRLWASGVLPSSPADGFDWGVRSPRGGGCRSAGRSVGLAWPMKYSCLCLEEAIWGSVFFWSRDGRETLWWLIHCRHTSLRLLRAGLFKKTFQRIYGCIALYYLRWPPHLAAIYTADFSPSSHAAWAGTQRVGLHKHDQQSSLLSEASGLQTHLSGRTSA